jgi:hypothetical protein
MTEPKKRGPKPKCKECGRKEGDGHYDDCPVGLGVAPDVVIEVKTASGVVTVEFPDAVERAQAYAERVWNGQSDTVIRQERLERVKRALEGQGLSMEGVVL